MKLVHRHTMIQLQWSLLKLRICVWHMNPFEKHTVATFHSREMNAFNVVQLNSFVQNKINYFYMFCLNNHFFLETKKKINHSNRTFQLNFDDKTLSYANFSQKNDLNSMTWTENPTHMYTEKEWRENKKEKERARVAIVWRMLLRNALY